MLRGVRAAANARQKWSLINLRILLKLKHLNAHVKDFLAFMQLTLTHTLKTLPRFPGLLQEPSEQELSPSLYRGNLCPLV